MSASDVPTIPSENGEEKVDPRSKGWIKPGEVRNPKGRGKGVRSKFGEEFVSALQRDFNEHGDKVIATVRADRPDVYLKVIASILPKELNVNTNALGDMSDDELAATLIALRDLATTLDVEIARAGASEKGSEAKAQRIQTLQ